MNTTYRFDWQQIVTEPFLAELVAATGTPGSEPDLLRALLARIFACSGGAGVANSDWPASHRTQVARKLLGEAVGSLLTHRFGFGHRLPGVVARVEHGEHVAAVVPVVDINRASRAELEALPAIGPALAGSIIAERRNGGAFSSMPNLLERLAGLGDEAGRQLQGALGFSASGAASRVVPARLADKLGALLLLGVAGAARDPLEAALEEVAMYVAAHPHPRARVGMKRDDLEPDAIAATADVDISVDRAKVLADTAYYSSLLGVIERATRQVDVCMFYVALPEPQHPTRKLLEALARKASEGRVVRVLVDQDNKGDPYGSRLVNAAAVALLSSRGVEVRGDASDALLHSKFVIVDNDTVAVGSHNWTAGSFFRYADVSVLLSGMEQTRRWRDRFETLWARGRAFDETGAAAARRSRGSRSRQDRRIATT
jgi:competence protein ComEA